MTPSKIYYTKTLQVKFMDKKMAVFKIEKNYTVMSNYHLRDKRMIFKKISTMIIGRNEIK